MVGLIRSTCTMLGLVMICGGLLVVTSEADAFKSKKKKPQEVKVINGPDMPASVNMENEPTVNVGNEPNVAVTNTVDTNSVITNDMDMPIPVVVKEGEVRVIRGTAIFIASGPTQELAGSPILYTVPDGKMLIIEDASAGYQMASTQTYPAGAWFSMYLSLQTSSGTSRNAGIGTTNLVGPGANPVTARTVGRTTKIYALPGANIRGSFARNFGGTRDAVFFWLFGREVPLP